MDSRTRTIAKAISWQLMGLVSMTLVGYLFTRSLTASSGIAIASAIVSFIFYCFHERLWSRVRWGRMTDPSS
ncbi:DUF2061 domain-containing protein [uncultured Cohaesibacter sp.]|uniref:DUF2061 domain-containing protein n=1 Tax=uncultured Cohaesibacter sp. TaxID=1002546 RepID=UPI0029C7A00B|nr:DUF2061 domain-containing protein [uncultured Cohaesibacter sp.]